MKNQSKNNASPWLCGAASLMFATAVLAGDEPQQPEPEQIAYRVELPTEGLGFQHMVSVPRFDPAQGQLQGVRISLETELVGSAQFENMSDEFVVATNAFGARFELRNPENGQLLAQTTPMQIYRMGLDAYDGVLDFGGRSGETHRPIVLQEDVGVDLQDWQLSSFIGAPDNAGNMQLDVSGAADNFGIGTPGVLSMYLSNGSATVAVSYVYMPAENQDGEKIGEN